jgi:hypothetical protein
VSLDNLPWNVELDPSPSAEDEALESVTAESRGHTLRILPKEGGGREPPPDKETGTRGGQLARQLADAFGVSNPRPEQLARAEGVVEDLERRIRRREYNLACRDITRQLERDAERRGDEDKRREFHALRRGLNRDLKRMEEEPG